MESLFGLKKNRARQSSVSNSELSDRSVPYDRLTASSSRSPAVQGAKQNSSPGHVISAPITNPTLTTDGTDLNLNALAKIRAERDALKEKDRQTEVENRARSPTASIASSRGTFSRFSQSSMTQETSAPRNSGSRREKNVSAPPVPRMSVSSTMSNPNDRRNPTSDFGQYPPSSPTVAQTPMPTGNRPLTSMSMRSDPHYSSRHVPASSSAPAESRLSHLHLRHGSQDEFYFPRPDTAEEIEALFEEVKAVREMPQNFNPDLEQKWTIVHNHEQLKWQEGKSRIASVKRQTAQGQPPNTTYTKDEPEWFLRKFMDMSITPQQVSSLSVSLRTLPIAYAS
jgi:cytokinesis protein